MMTQKKQLLLIGGIGVIAALLAGGLAYGTGGGVCLSPDELFTKAMKCKTSKMDDTLVRKDACIDVQCGVANKPSACLNETQMQTLADSCKPQMKKPQFKRDANGCQTVSCVADIAAMNAMKPAEKIAYVKDWGVVGKFYMDTCVKPEQGTFVKEGDEDPRVSGSMMLSRTDLADAPAKKAYWSFQPTSFTVYGPKGKLAMGALSFEFTEKNGKIVVVPTDDSCRPFVGGEEDVRAVVRERR